MVIGVHQRVPADTTVNVFACVANP